MLGVIVLLVGVVGLVIGLVFFLKMKRMAAAPFHKTGEIARNPGVADAKGMVSTEGQVNPQNAVRAPCSGQPCLYYEVTVERQWEKMVRTQNGTQKKTGSTNVLTNKGGAMFQLDDGSGPVNVDAREGVDGDLKKSHEERHPMGMMVPGELVFGQMRVQTPSHLSDDRTTGFRAVEKILPAEGSLYACGKLAGGAIAKPGWTSLILSHKGRDALMGSTKTKAYVGFAVGALFAVGSVPAFLFGPKASASTGGTDCPTALKDVQPKCDDRIYEANGKDYTWTVTKAGLYTVRVVQPNVANPIDSALTIKDGKGAQVGYNDGGTPGADAKVQQSFDPGTYSINVRDFSHDTVEGGYSYELVITLDGPPTSSPAQITAATVTAPAATATPAKAPAGTAHGAKPSPAPKKGK